VFENMLMKFWIKTKQNQTRKDNVIMMVFKKHYKHDDWSVKKKQKERAWVMVTKKNPIIEEFMDQRV